MFSGINHVKRLSKRKNKISETWLRNRTELNHDEMRRAKINCNKVIAQAKNNIQTKIHWEDYLLHKRSNKL